MAARVVRAAGLAVAAGVGAYVGFAVRAWARYGHARPERRPYDRMLEAFLPDPDVDEYQRVRVHAPAGVTFASAKRLNLRASRLIRVIFWLRRLPGLLRGHPEPPQAPAGLLAETLSLGWGVLAEEEGREIVVGAYTQPWRQDVRFHSLPPEEFAAFREPGYVKIVWTLAAEPDGESESLLLTRTRAVATSPDARTKFRRYWGPVSAGVVLVRYLGLAQVKRDAETSSQFAAGRSPSRAESAPGGSAGSRRPGPVAARSGPGAAPARGQTGHRSCR